MKKAIIVAALGLGLAGCTSQANQTKQACAYVHFWADTTGAVRDPDGGQVFTERDAMHLGEAAWGPISPGAADFLNLYDSLDSPMSDAAYSAEAVQFVEAHC